MKSAVAFLWIVSFAVLCGSTGTCSFGQDDVSSETAAEKTKASRSRKVYMGRRIAAFMPFHGGGAEWLFRETRKVEEEPQLVLDQLGIEPGMVVCDLGCGNGFYTLQLAEKVGGEGQILAVDIQSEMLHELKNRAAQANLENIQLVLGEPDNPKLPDSKVDLVLMVDVYHEFSHPEEMLAAIRKALKPEGMIALVEFRAEDPRVNIKPLHKMSKEQILKEYSANGFRLVKEFDGLPIQHLMFLGPAPIDPPNK